MSEALIFPLRNEQGFKVDSLIAYQHMINTIVAAQTELVQDYPEQQVMVVFEV